MKRVAILAAIVLLLLPGIAVAAGSCTATTVTRQAVLITTYSCTADASDGSFPATASTAMKGWVFAVDTYPGTTQPTDNYDITLTIAYGAKTLDVMGGALANRDTLNAERAYPAGTAFVNGPLTLNISNNSVNSASVTVVVYAYKEP